MKKAIKIMLAVLAGILLLVLAGLILTGRYVGWGPFTDLQFNAHEKKILEKYPVGQRTGEIIFYSPRMRG